VPEQAEGLARGTRRDGTINGGQIGGQIVLNDRQKEIVSIIKEKKHTYAK